tara:strand:+ start:205 stop:429 length:225 start_codon:yes stop_codon:yes gene_type:complete
MDKETATPSHKRFQGYYLDYLVRFDSIGSYAASYGLTHETAKHRIKLGEQIHNETAARATLNDAMAATGLAFDF